MSASPDCQGQQKPNDTNRRARRDIYGKPARKGQRHRFFRGESPLTIHLINTAGSAYLTQFPAGANLFGGGGGSTPQSAPGTNR
jgi:hypothetical protein